MTPAPWISPSTTPRERPRSSSMIVGQAIDNNNDVLNDDSKTKRSSHRHKRKSKSDQNLSKQQKSPTITLTTAFETTSHTKKFNSIVPQPSF